MEHQGVKYTVVQTINPPGWKWSFEREGRSPRTKIAFNRAEAVSAAERAISQTIRDQQRQLWRPVCSSCFNVNGGAVLGMLPCGAGLAMAQVRVAKARKQAAENCKRVARPLQFIDSSSNRKCSRPNVPA
jgi:hypothetical protein